jgi:hypothetical protein
MLGSDSWELVTTTPVGGRHYVLETRSAASELSMIHSPELKSSAQT